MIYFVILSYHMFIFYTVVWVFVPLFLDRTAEELDSGQEMGERERE